MMVRPSPSASIALRASTFDELSALLPACRAAGKALELSEAEQWWLATASEKIYTALVTSEYGSAVGIASSLAAVRATLLARLRLQKSGGDLAAIVDHHREWLSTLEAALATVRPDDLGLEGSRSLMELATRPFSQLIRAVLAQELDTVADQLHVADDILVQLAAEPMRRFRLGIGGSLEADLKIHAAERTRLDGDRAEPDRETYASWAFSSAHGFEAFLTRFPVLARWLSLSTGQVIRNSRRLFARLIADREALGLGHAGPIRLEAIELGKSDAHCGGDSVSILHLRGTDGPTKIVYKPRSVAAERAWNEILAMASQGAGLRLPCYTVHDRQAYGWCEYIPHGLNQVDDWADVAAIYTQLGAYLGLFYLFGGTDLHLENVLISGANAYVVDCETLLGVPVLGAHAGRGTLADSVYRTGLLEWPGATGASASLKLSGIGGGGSFKLSEPVPVVRGDADTTTLRVELEPDVEVDLGFDNRIFCCGRLADPADFLAEMTAGFEKVCRLLSSDEDVIKPVEAALEKLKVRFVNRATESYSRALRAAQHPRCLMDPLEVDLMFELFCTNQKRYDLSGRIAREEVRQLWCADIPYFVSEATGRDIASGLGEVVHTSSTTPLEAGMGRLKHFDMRSAEQQSRYIRGAFGSHGDDREFQAVLLSYAERIGELLSVDESRLTDHPWWTYQFDWTGKRRAPVDTSLYDGSAGIALFLAYLNHLAPSERVKASAEVALRHCLASESPTEVGAFRGLGSRLYVLAHLSQLWRSDELAREACHVVAQIDPLIEHDRDYDVLVGGAGALKCLLAAEGVGGASTLAAARRCGEHLLRNALESGDTISWAPSDPSIATANLTGFAHGAAGVGCALIHLGDRLGERRYIDAGLAAYRYEALHFDQTARDWIDLRTSPAVARRSKRRFANAWCNGASGIGLSRLDSWRRIRHARLMEEANIACSATIENFHSLGNDTLCHGRSGNLELLLRMALLRDDHALRLEVQAQSYNIMRDLEDILATPLDSPDADVSPGLMIGLAGIGMFLLRLAHPDCVPSPLLLDAPISTASCA
jgi:class II lanthipeptide synthase